MKFITTIVFAVSILMVGCSPSQMTIDEDYLDKIDPIGLYVIGSTQILDNGDVEHRDFTINIASNDIPKIFKKKGFDVKLLNHTMSIKEVFAKPFGTFYIDEKKVAKAAKDEGCSTYLIVYFAYAGKLDAIDIDLSAYSYCSLYGWLGSSKDADVITSSHTALNSFKDFKFVNAKNFLNISEKNKYKEFLKSITRYMFEKIADNPRGIIY